MGYWDGDMGAGRDVLWRIVALLFSLAALADRAAGLHGRRQRDLLMILSWGEAEGRSLVTGVPVDALSVADASQPAGGASCRTDAAAVLAARFRVLALALWFALTRERRRKFSFGRPQAGRLGRAWFGGDGNLPAPDTS